MGSEDLHYGYWPKGKDASVQNFAHAQDSHSKLIMDHIPEKTNSILDVGGGSGNLALKLLDKGYSVDCVIPSEYLAEQAKEKLWDDLKENMKEWSSSAVEKAEEMSRIAMAKTEEMTRISKIKFEIHQLQREMGRKYEELGHLAYSHTKEDHMATFSGNTEFFNIVKLKDRKSVV